MTLLEREPLLEVLAARLSDAASGAGQIALVYGEAGIGKTALVDCFTREYARDGATLCAAARGRLAAGGRRVGACRLSVRTGARAGDEEARLTAVEAFDRLGARPDLDRLRQRLRAEGVRRIPRGPRPSTRHNSFGLTARETEIVGLLARPLTNSRMGRACTSHRRPSTTTSRRSWPSWAWPRGRRRDASPSSTGWRLTASSTMESDQAQDREHNG
jgi:hypothetical protein